MRLRSRDAGGRSGLGSFVAVSGKGSSPGAGSESNAFGLQLIFADNYNLTTNNFTTEDAQRLFSRAIFCKQQLVILAVYRQQRRAVHRALVVRLRLWPPVDWGPSDLVCVSSMWARMHARAGIRAWEPFKEGFLAG